MSLRVAHISDVHIRSAQFHAEYRTGFKNLTEQLERDNPDLIVVAGDLIHTKTNISADLVDMLFLLFKYLNAWPTIVLPGNHDYNVKNLNKKNILEVLKAKVGSNIFIAGTETDRHYVRDVVKDERLYRFHLIPFGASLAVPEEWRDDCSARIAVWHGTVANSRTDVGYRFTGEGNLEVSNFRGYDFGLLGDIHRRQFLDDQNRFAYCGSLFQQDFGEEAEKGYLLWEIEDRDRFEVLFREVAAGKNFYTFNYEDIHPAYPRDLISKCKPASRIRVRCEAPLTSEQKAGLRNYFASRSIKDIQYKIEPKESTTVAVSVSKEKLGNLRDLKIQRDLVSAYCKKDLDILGVHDSIVQELETSKKEVLQDYPVWTAREVSFENFFSYRGASTLDLASRRGTVGIFGENKSGKCVDAATEVTIEFDEEEIIKLLGFLPEELKKVP